MIVESEGAFAHRILHWFDANARELPWRNPPGRALPLDDPDWPYRVWLSEIMLQQTTVAAVKPYFTAFVNRWPSVGALAAAADSDVMAAWAGLGYYARARNLMACARAVVAEQGGVFPQTEAELLTLPGVGGYTAAAIAAIAFGRHAVVVDGNIERVMARVFAVETPVPAAKAQLKRLTSDVTPSKRSGFKRSGDFAQAMMDLGATVCTPRNPACLTCPVNDLCLGRTRATDFPVKRAKEPKPHRTGICWWIEQGDNVLLIRRPDTGMLGGMRALPSDDWDAKNSRGRNCKDHGILCGGEWMGSVDHVFSHFSLSLEIRSLPTETSCIERLDGEWWPKARIADAGLPSLFAKAAHLALTRRR